MPLPLLDIATYDAYGQRINSTGTTQNSYRFAGEQFDSNVGQYYLRARYYDTSNGRFTRRDTYEGKLRNPLTLHRYTYSHANPVNATDPSGLTTLGEIDAAESIRNALAQIQQQAGGYLISATQKRGNYKVGDFALEVGRNAFFALAPVLASYGVLKGKQILGSLQNTSGGSGVGNVIPVIDEVEDVAVVQQFTNNACGTACGHILFEDRGINVTQQQIAEQAGDTFLHEKDLEKAMRALDSTSSTQWYGDYAIPSSRSIAKLNETGSWAAQVGHGWDRHWIVVDGYDELGNLMIRDPWGISAVYDPSRGMGTRYTVLEKDFIRIWTSLVVYKN